MQGGKVALWNAGENMVKPRVRSEVHQIDQVDGEDWTHRREKDRFRWSPIKKEQKGSLDDCLMLKLGVWGERTGWVDRGLGKGGDRKGSLDGGEAWTPLQ